jgi:NDP-sugar pyrophosphorylase family protein
MLALMRTAFVLAGGKGTRLGDSMPPKCMLDINGRSVLERQLDWLESEGFDNAVLCLGHRNDEVRFEKRRMNVVVSVEDAPRGTGGAVRLAFSSNPGLCAEGVYVLNVDDLADVDIDLVLGKAGVSGKSLIIAKPVPFSVWVQDRMHAQNSAMQHIGHAFLRQDFLAALQGLPDSFSLEKQISEWNDRFEVFAHDGRWITVNSEEQLEQARRMLKP